MDYSSTPNRSKLFTAFRSEDGYIKYDDNRMPVTYDVNEAAIIYACVLISISTLIAVIGIRGKERWNALIRVAFSLFIGSVILVSLNGHGWMEGNIAVNTTYIFSKHIKFSGILGINVALDHANISLRGTVDQHSFVEYKEKFSWKDLGDAAESFFILSSRGAPQPILTVSDYLSVDVGGLRWGRSYFLAGHFAGILLWSSFAFWIVTNVMLFSVVYYSAIMLFMTGTCMVLSPVAYHILQPISPLSIPYGQERLKLKYGWCFWLPLITGAFNVIISLLLLIFDHFAKKKLANFFGLETEVSPDEDSSYDSQFRNGYRTSQVTGANFSDGFTYENSAYNGPSSKQNSPKMSESSSSGYARSMSSGALELSKELPINSDNHLVNQKSTNKKRNSRLDELYVDVETPNNTLVNAKVEKFSQKTISVSKNPVFDDQTDTIVVNIDNISIEENCSSGDCRNSSSQESCVSSVDDDRPRSAQTVSSCSVTDVTEVQSHRL